MTKIIKKIFDVIFVIVIVSLALYFVLRADNRIRIYNVMTGSMEDNIHAGDYILILKQDDYKIGDVVTFGENGYYITHRIIKKEGNSITTKGDANNTEDETIEKHRIVGKVIFIGGILNFVINNKFALSGILLALYLLSCYFEKNDFKKNEKKSEEKTDFDEEKLEIEDSSEEKLEIEASSEKEELESKKEEKTKETVEEIFEENIEEKNKKGKRKTRKKKEEDKKD